MCVDSIKPVCKVYFLRCIALHCIVLYFTVLYGMVCTVCESVCVYIYTHTHARICVICIAVSVYFAYDILSFYVLLKWKTKKGLSG